jgi:hypothetical protein
MCCETNAEDKIDSSSTITAKQNQPSTSRNECKLFAMQKKMHCKLHFIEPQHRHAGERKRGERPAELRDSRRISGEPANFGTAGDHLRDPPTLTAQAKETI